MAVDPAAFNLDPGPYQCPSFARHQCYGGGNDAVLLGLRSKSAECTETMKDVLLGFVHSASIDRLCPHAQNQLQNASEHRVGPFMQLVKYTEIRRNYQA
jgi:hypothetical protein